MKILILLLLTVNSLFAQNSTTFDISGDIQGEIVKIRFDLGYIELSKQKLADYFSYLSQQIRSTDSLNANICSNVAEFISNQDSLKLDLTKDALSQFYRSHGLGAISDGSPPASSEMMVLMLDETFCYFLIFALPEINLFNEEGIKHLTVIAQSETNGKRIFSRGLTICEQ